MHFATLVAMYKSIAVTRKDINPKPAVLPLFLLGIFIMCICVIPMIISHMFCFVYNWIAMPLMGIPRVYFRDFLVLDRGRLSKLNAIQKLGCLYCGYANALMAWLKASANTTEAYWCAVKHNAKRKGQEHQEDFYAYEELN